MSFSVLIIVKNRQQHLQHVLDGIAGSGVQPAEVVIVHMNEAVTPLTSELPLIQIALNSDHPLPLAAARNAAAAQATTDRLIFLDVDCIPAPECFSELLQDLQSHELVMADPLYLAHPVQTLDFTALEKTGQINPVRRSLALGRSDNFELFWSLGFAIRKTDFLRIGGFDESYVGYGGEDTDFAFRARVSGLHLCFSQARIYHQNHPSYDPPLNWLEDIVSNARHFKNTWGDWPMRGWLEQFAALGYITWTADTITISRLPTATEIAAALKPTAL